MAQKIEKNRFTLKNRAEELQEDVWETFLLPPFYNSLDLREATKPRVIIGGRGSGKTMLLKHFSYKTTFSPNRSNIDNSEINHIGLYKKFDIQFCKMMYGRGLEEDVWENAFRHYLISIFFQEILNSLETIANSNIECFERQNLYSLNFDPLNDFYPGLPVDFDDLKTAIRQNIGHFELWVSNVRDMKQPVFFPVNFLERLVETLKNQEAVLKDTSFHIYIDEFENLRNEHKRVINTYIKHSFKDLIFSYAMKKIATPLKETCGTEQINEPDDYKTYELDELHRDDNKKWYQVFAAEILLSELQSKGLGNFRINSAGLKDPDFLQTRLSDSYRTQILEQVEAIFPALKQADLASMLLEDTELVTKLGEKIHAALTRCDGSYKTEDFLDFEYPLASVIMPALLNRKSRSPEDTLKQFNAYKEKDNKQFQSLIHNNFLASYLQLYNECGRKECPAYTGFSTFCHLSNGNIRHFLFLCENSFQHADITGPLDKTSITYQEQSRGARITSSRVLNEVKGFGSYGLKLHQFIMRIGSMFELDGKSLTLSENERNHFAIVSEKDMRLSGSAQNLLDEAERWSVLYQTEATKKKDEASPEQFEYVLNPIFAPYFLISYRKKRRMEVSAQVVETLFNGSLEEYRSFIIEYKNKLIPEGESEETLLTLFDVVEG